MCVLSHNEWLKGLTYVQKADPHKVHTKKQVLNNLLTNVHISPFKKPEDFQAVQKTENHE